MCLSYALRFPKSLIRRSRVISACFRLVENIRAKYSVLDYDFYNFDETGFIIGIIYPVIVVTYTDRRDKGKVVQLGNRE